MVQSSVNLSNQLFSNFREPPMLTSTTSM